MGKISGLYLKKVIATPETEFVIFSIIFDAKKWRSIGVSLYSYITVMAVSYTHLTLPTILLV